MADLVIEAEQLSKQYQLGASRAPYRTLRDALLQPFQRQTTAKAAHPSIWALRDVSFQVEEGQVLGIIGSNGSGKSTLLKILSRITAPTTGRARIRGRVGTLLEVGTGFHLELSGRENIFLNGTILGMRRQEIERKFDEIVEFAEVGPFIDTPVKHYSSGMYLRLAFGVAAHLEPEILIVDEVLAVGDAAFQKRCLGKMGEVAQSGRTVLFVSHNMGAVRGLCQRALWLDKGRVRAVGPTFEVIDHYLQTTLDPAAQVIDLASIVRRVGLAKRLHFTQLVFNQGRSIHHGQPLEAQIRFETVAAIEEAAIGLSLTNLDGTRLLSSDSDLQGHVVQLESQQAYQVTCLFDQLNLQPGHYAVDIWARSGDLNLVDYIQGCGQIEILPGPSTPPALIQGEASGVRQPARWDWAEVVNHDNR